MKNVIVGILSSKNSEARVRGCRLSWAAELEKRGVPYVFLIGEPALQTEYRRDRDILYIRCADDYDSVVFKTHFFFKWAVEAGRYSHFFKCDDDTYINVGALLKFDPKMRDFIGHRLYLDAVGYYPSGGAGYVLSPRAAGLIASNDFHAYISGDHKKRPEDVLVALFLARNGIALSPENSRFNHRRCRIFSRWVSCHHITEEADFRTPAGLLPWRLYAKLRLQSIKRYSMKAVSFIRKRLGGA